MSQSQKVLPDTAQAKQDSMTVWLRVNTENSRNLELVVISAIQYNRYRRNYHLDIDKSESRIIRTSKEIKINTLHRILTYQADTTNYSEFSYYKGYLPQLKAYIIDEVNAANEISNLELVDSISGKLYIFETAFDNSSAIPLPSPGLKFLLSYANDLYMQRGSSLSVLQINRKAQHLYSEYSNYSFKDKKIESICWINNSAFAVKLMPLEATIPQYLRLRLKE